MANYICYARTNYFEVKDPAKFETEMDKILGGSVQVQKSTAGLYALFPEDSFPSFFYPDENDFAEEEIDWCELMKRHLVDGETAVFMEVGHEKIRYVSGMAWAIHSDGSYCEISTEEIYNKASQEFGCDTPASCSY